MKPIKIAVKAKKHLLLSDLHPLQGELKTLSKQRYDQLKNEIITMGFSEPIFVWLRKGKHYILDGHQRMKTLEMMELEDYEIPPIPVAVVEAKTESDARKKILSFISVFGTMTDDGLVKYCQNAGIELAAVSARFNFPDVDVKSLMDGGKKAEKAIEVDQSKVRESLVTFQTSAIKSIVLYFEDRDYEKYIQKIEDLRQKHDLIDNSALVRKLVEDATN